MNRESVGEDRIDQLISELVELSDNDRKKVMGEFCRYCDDYLTSEDGTSYRCYCSATYDE